MKKSINTVLALSAALNLLMAEEVKVEKITVTTATKSEKKVEGVSASVIVIDEKEIEKLKASDLGEILERTPGLVRQYGTFPSASAKSKSSITIRGMGPKGTLLLIDGERVAGEVTNPYDFDRIPASAIERIEIVKGPMSTLYGADAVGGVINIITKKPKEKFSGSFGIKTGANDKGDGEKHNVDLNFRGKIDKIKYSFYVGGLKTTPYTQEEIAKILIPAGNNKVPPSQHPDPRIHSIKDQYKTDVTYREYSKIFNTGLNLDFDIKDNILAGLSFKYLDEEREGTYNAVFHPTGYKNNQGKPIPAFNPPVNTRDDNKRRQISGKIEWLATDDLVLNFKVYNSYYEKRNKTTMKHYKDFGYNSEEESESSGMNANVDITSYEIMGNYTLNEKNLLTFGSEYRDEKRDATVFDNEPDMDTKKVQYKSIYLQDEYEYSDSLNFIAGIRYDDISNSENKATFKIGAVKNFSKLLNLRLNFAQGYRAPDIRELYINKQTPMGFMQGSEVVGYDLKPEFTNSYEIGFSGKKDNFNYSISLFLNRVKDRIEQVAGNKPKTYTFKNISKAKTYGMETDLTYIFNNLITKLSWSELRTENEENDKDLEFNPKRTVTLSIDYSINDAATVSVIGRHIGKQFYTIKKEQGLMEDWTDSFTLVDISGSYKFGKNNQYEIYCGINNIFDEKVDDILGSNVGPFGYIGARYIF